MTGRSCITHLKFCITGSVTPCGLYVCSSENSAGNKETNALRWYTYTTCSIFYHVRKCPWYTAGGKMSDKNLLQRINIKFCVKIGKSASETLDLLQWLTINTL
jgi:hypothetical protein